MCMLFVDCFDLVVLLSVLFFCFVCFCFYCESDFYLLFYDLRFALI